MHLSWSGWSLSDLCPRYVELPPLVTLVTRYHSRLLHITGRFTL